MIQIAKADGVAERKLIEQLKQRSGEIDRTVTAAVSEILQNVRQYGDTSVREYTMKFDGSVPENPEISKEALDASIEQCDSDFIYALYKAADNIRDFHTRQKQQSWLTPKDNGVILGQRIRGLHRVGIYVPVGGSVVESQLKAVLSDLNVKAVKIGMVPDAGVAHVIAAALREYKASHDCHVVYDPVMISTSGRRLMAADCLDVVVEELMPLCTLVTPNIPEAEFLAAKTGIVCEGGALADALHASILIKGGHSDGEVLADSLFNPDGSSQSFKSERIDTRNLHGTGCTLSSAIAAFLLKGLDIPSAIPQAKALLAHAIMRGKDAGIGKGNGPILPGKQ